MLRKCNSMYNSWRTKQYSVLQILSSTALIIQHHLFVVKKKFHLVGQHLQKRRYSAPLVYTLSIIEVRSIHTLGATQPLFRKCCPLRLDFFYLHRPSGSISCKLFQVTASNPPKLANTECWKVTGVHQAVKSISSNT